MSYHQGMNSCNVILYYLRGNCKESLPIVVPHSSRMLRSILQMCERTRWVKYAVEVAGTKKTTAQILCGKK